MKERFGAKKEESLLLRFHTQTAGCSLTAQQPENNIVRTAYEGLAAVLGGTQSLHTNSMDEVLALPSEKAAEIALRTQQIIGYETGVSNTIDPLAGSYFVEAMTDRMESECLACFDEIEAEGGVLEAIEKGYFQRRIADAAYRYQMEIERGERIIVGMNRFEHSDEAVDIELLKIDPALETEQVASVRRVRAERDQPAADDAMSELRRRAEGSDNLMPAIIECARAHLTQGEIVGVLKEVFGEYKERPIY
jgi:methylmalonyl-CoA mutase N-terminal domain/subunit